ncbi:NADP-dependent oxidoreductase domain-containing protein [Lasiosphaeria ovina]|uniref:NADP-dependent oxidoreductase domain-containing protein n=1 Tax=Lasiosphaeria ovina TaxID=92902 RepID=A0AAE0TUN0_9PEZI|nr:NADP-dependent oxidoreductase domain-containing protein [Lasiosphaeria ovina]
MAALTINSKIKLPSGYEIPQLGYGLYQTPPEDTEKVSKLALEAGYTHFDSAAFYDNEDGAGRAIRTGTKLPREQIFFTSKVPPGSVSYDGAKATIDQTLAKSELGYVDLMLLHAPYGGSANRKGAWRALVEAVEAGKVRSIGVSNYGVQHLDELERHIAELEAERGGPGKGGVLSAGQWEIHPWCARRDITDWCAARGVAVQAYTPLVRGKRWGDPALKKLADKYNKSEAQVLIRWSLQKGFIPLPKSVTPDRIRSNADVYDFALTPEEVAGLETDGYAPVAGWDPTVAPLEA